MLILGLLGKKGAYIISLSVTQGGETARGRGSDLCHAFSLSKGDKISGLL